MLRQRCTINGQSITSCKAPPNAVASPAPTVQTRRKPEWRGLKWDGQHALFDTDQKINAVHQAIVDRLTAHDEVHIITKFGVVRGLTFRITEQSRVAHRGCRNPEKDKGLQEFFSSDAEMQSPLALYRPLGDLGTP